MKTLANAACIAASLIIGLLCSGATAQASSVKFDADAARAYSNQARHNVKAAELYEQAIPLMNKGRFFQASSILEQVLKLDPSCVAAYASDGYCLFNVGHGNEGSEQLTKAIGMNSNVPEYFFRRAQCDFSNDKYIEAIAGFTHVLEKEPGNSDALRLRARCYRASGDLIRTMQDFNQLCNHKKYAAEAHCDRGQLYNHAEQYDKALPDFDEAISLRPGYGDAYLFRGDAFYHLKQYRAALDNYIAASVYGTDKASYAIVQIALLKRLLNTNKHGTADEGLLPNRRASFK